MIQSLVSKKVIKRFVLKYNKVLNLLTTVQFNISSYVQSRCFGKIMVTPFPLSKKNLLKSSIHLRGFSYVNSKLIPTIILSVTLGFIFNLSGNTFEPDKTSIYMFLFIVSSVIVASELCCMNGLMSVCFKDLGNGVFIFPYQIRYSGHFQDHSSSLFLSKP